MSLGGIIAEHISGMPDVVILAGPNGAGKTSSAPVLLRDELRVSEFVNADVIARGLSTPFTSSISGCRLPIWRAIECTSGTRMGAIQCQMTWCDGDTHGGGTRERCT
jgi:hypothetical protein